MQADKVVEIKIAIEGIEQAVKHIAYTEGKVDWEQRRYEIAKSAMNAILTNREMVAAMLLCPNPKGFEYQVARKSVSFADALIAELKKKGE